LFATECLNLNFPSKSFLLLAFKYSCVTTNVLRKPTDGKKKKGITQV
jgi:hypothetical protein